MTKEKGVMKTKVHKVMHEFKHGELHSGSKHGPEVKSRKQAVAIALGEGRKAERGGYSKHPKSAKKHGAYKYHE